MAHMPRNAPSCRSGKRRRYHRARRHPAGDLARPCANDLVSRTRRKISRSEKLTPTADGRLAQRVTPWASVTPADEYSLGNFSRTLVR